MRIFEQIQERRNWSEEARIVLDQVQRLADGGAGYSFTFTHGRARWAAEYFQDIMLHLTIPTLHGAVTIRHAVKFFINSGYVANSIH